MTDGAAGSANERSRKRYSAAARWKPGDLSSRGNWNKSAVANSSARGGVNGERLTGARILVFASDSVAGNAGF